MEEPGERNEGKILTKGKARDSAVEKSGETFKPYKDFVTLA